MAEWQSLKLIGFQNFPQASHQVILLSTDEEINAIHYRHLKPHIGREYHISYQEDQQTSINLGYFFQSAY